MPLYRISTEENNKTFEHSHWRKGNLSIIVQRTYENSACIKDFIDSPSFVQNSGPYGNSVNILSENCSSIETLNLKLESISYSDLIDKNERKAIFLAWSENKEQGLINSNWEEIKREIWLSGQLKFIEL